MELETSPLTVRHLGEFGKNIKYMLYQAFPVLWIMVEYRRMKDKIQRLELTVSYIKSCYLFFYIWMIFFLEHFFPENHQKIIECAVIFMFGTFSVPLISKNWDQVSLFNFTMGVTFHLFLLGKITELQWFLYLAITLVPNIHMQWLTSEFASEIEPEGKLNKAGVAGSVILVYGIAYTSAPTIFGHWKEHMPSFSYAIGIAFILAVISVIITANRGFTEHGPFKDTFTKKQPDTLPETKNNRFLNLYC